MKLKLLILGAAGCVLSAVATPSLAMSQTTAFFGYQVPAQGPVTDGPVATAEPHSSYRSYEAYGADASSAPAGGTTAFFGYQVPAQGPVANGPAR